MNLWFFGLVFNFLFSLPVTILFIYAIGYRILSWRLPNLKGKKMKVIWYLLSIVIGFLLFLVFEKWDYDRDYAMQMKRHPEFLRTR